jgi:hypothetical protein
MNNNEQLSLLDTLNILSFIIGILNYNENLTQDDKQELMREIDNKISLVLDKVQKHLEIQDKQLNIIIKRLEELEIDR